MIPSTGGALRDHRLIAVNPPGSQGSELRDRDAMMKTMEELAKSIGLPWPVDKDASEEELIERLNRLYVAFYSRELDRAIEAPAAR